VTLAGTGLAVTLLVTVAGLVFVAGAAATTTTLDSPPPPTANLQIRFVQAEFATHYTTSLPKGEHATYAWTLSPPSVDPACDNHGVLTSDTDEFIWHHPDAIDSVPYNYYHCQSRGHGA